MRGLYGDNENDWISVQLAFPGIEVPMSNKATDPGSYTKLKFSERWKALTHQ